LGILVYNNNMINKDAFSNGQIESKLWLCNELEKLNWHSDLTHIYGGWYGITAFLLLTRQRFSVKKIESFDIDPHCESVADMINENWVFNDWQFKAYTADCNQYIEGTPDLIINTSTEHFDSMHWFDKIPEGTRIVIQGNNMPHEDHCIYSENIVSFIDRYPIAQSEYIGEKEFVYPDWKFTRFMMIGTK